ncbi:MAG: nuclear transport factor 2 family protein [Proteobacteria bacterium]|nr:nuclear transport factor 2 family protein [Pseudomonadota bacterium]
MGRAIAKSDRDDVLRVNEAFYDAFSAGDLVALEEIWAVEPPVACIHPRWPALLDRYEIIESFRRVMTMPSPPRPTCVNPRAFVYGDVAMVVGVEVTLRSRHVATNLYRRRRGGWKMIHHHVTEGPHPPLPGIEETR